MPGGADNENTCQCIVAVQQKAALQGSLAYYVTPGLREAENPESSSCDFKR